MARGVASLVIRQCNFKRWQSHLVLLVMFGLTGKIGIAKPVAPTRRPCPSSPSESYGFPDHFTRTVTPSPKPKNEELEAAPLETRQKKPSIVALPSPKPQPAPATSPENSEAVRSKPAVPVPNPALRRASAPPPRIPGAPRSGVAKQNASIHCLRKHDIGRPAAARDPGAVVASGQRRAGLDHEHFNDCFGGCCSITPDNLLRVHADAPRNRALRSIRGAARSTSCRQDCVFAEFTR